MPDIFEIANQTGVSLRTLRKLDKHGFLKTSKAKEPELEKIYYNCRRGNAISAAQLFMLHKKPDWVDLLGHHAARARRELDSLGNIERDGAPWAISSLLPDCANGDESAIGQISAWLRQHIASRPEYADGQPYAYVAVRLLANVPEHLWEFNFRVLNAAIMRLRRHPSFAGFLSLNEQKKMVFHHEKLDL